MMVVWITIAGWDGWGGMSGDESLGVLGTS